MKTVIFGYDHVGSFTVIEPTHPEILDLARTEDFGSAILGDTVQMVSEPSLLRPLPLKTRLNLAIDLDETMFRSHGSYLEIAIRPGAIDLLKFLSEHEDIDVVFWTASMEVHAIRCLLLWKEFIQGQSSNIALFTGDYGPSLRSKTFIF